MSSATRTEAERASVSGRASAKPEGGATATVSGTVPEASSGTRNVANGRAPSFSTLTDCVIGADPGRVSVTWSVDPGAIPSALTVASIAATSPL